MFDKDLEILLKTDPQTYARYKTQIIMMEAEVNSAKIQLNLWNILWRGQNKKAIKQAEKEARRSKG